MSLNESIVEDAALEWFGELGHGFWSVVRSVFFPSPRLSPPGRGGNGGTDLERVVVPARRRPRLLPSPWGEGSRVRETAASVVPSGLDSFSRPVGTPLANRDTRH